MSARAKDLLAWCLSVLPDDPPSHDLSGWTRAMREEWEARLDEIRGLVEDSSAHGESRADQVPVAVIAAAAGSPERAMQIERVGLLLDPEKPSRLCSVCLSPDHPAALCQWDYSR